MAGARCVHTRNVRVGTTQNCCRKDEQEKLPRTCSHLSPGALADRSRAIVETGSFCITVDEMTPSLHHRFSAVQPCLAGRPIMARASHLRTIRFFLETCIFWPNRRMQRAVEYHLLSWWRPCSAQTDECERRVDCCPGPSWRPCCKVVILPTMTLGSNRAVNLDLKFDRAGHVVQGQVSLRHSN
jgi:hypothetical protein